MKRAREPSQKHEEKARLAQLLAYCTYPSYPLDQATFKQAMSELQKFEVGDKSIPMFTICYTNISPAFFAMRCANMEAVRKCWSLGHGFAMQAEKGASLTFDAFVDHVVYITPIERQVIETNITTWITELTTIGHRGICDIIRSYLELFEAMVFTKSTRRDLATWETWEHGSF